MACSSRCPVTSPKIAHTNLTLYVCVLAQRTYDALAHLAFVTSPTSHVLTSLKHKFLQSTYLAWLQTLNQYTLLPTQALKLSV